MVREVWTTSPEHLCVNFSDSGSRDSAPEYLRTGSGELLHSSSCIKVGISIRPATGVPVSNCERIMGTSTDWEIGGDVYSVHDGGIGGVLPCGEENFHHKGTKEHKEFLRPPSPASGEGDERSESGGGYSTRTVRVNRCPA